MFRFSKFVASLFTAGLLIPLIVAGMGLAGAVPAAAAPVTYYIDCAAGSDANNGTSTSTPWRTFVNVNGHVFAAGDSILLRRGVTCSGIGGLTPKGSGTSASPITLGAYGTGTLPWIQSGANHAIALTDVQGWVVQEVHVSSQLGGGQSAGMAGIYLNTDTTAMTYFRILNVESTGNWYGMLLGRYKAKESGTATLNDVIVDGANVHDNEGPGIEGSGYWMGNSTGQNEPARNEGMTVRNSQFTDNGKDGVVLTATHNGLIEYNVSARSGLSGDDRYGFWFWNSNDVTLQFNEVYETKSVTSKGAGGLDCDYHVTNCVAQYNYAHDDDGPGILMIGKGKESLLGCTVRYNIFEREAKGPYQNGVILPFGAVKNCKVYNNTVYFDNTANTAAGSDGSYALLGWTWGGFGQGANNTYSNNIFYLAHNPAFPLSARGARLESGQIGTGFVYDHNLWYSTDGNIRYDYNGTIYSSVSAACSGSGVECTSIQANPQFSAVNTGPTGYSLNAGSPAINAGLVFDTNNGGRDYFGNMVPQGGAPDMGAVESGGGGGPTATPAPPTNTPTRTFTPAPTNTPTAGPSPTPTRTSTPTNTVPPTNTPTRTNTPAPTATPGGSTVMHVLDIWTSDSAGTPKTVFTAGAEDIYWHVKIVDQNGNPVSGASVSTHTTKANGAGYDNAQTTGVDGVANFNKNLLNNEPNGTWTITVTNVTKAGATYNSSANVKTSTNFTVQ